MRWLRTGWLALALSALLCAPVSAQNKPVFTSPLPTGVRLVITTIPNRGNQRQPWHELLNPIACP